MTARLPLLLVAMKEEAQAFPARRREGARRLVGIGGRDHDFLLSGPGRGAIHSTLRGREGRFAAVLQVGFAGALRPEMAAGEVYRIASVRGGEELIEVEDDPIFAAFSALPRRRLVTAPAPVGAGDKALMHGHDAADLVDMESIHALRICRAAGIPWCGLRVVSDALDEDLPAALFAAWDGQRFRLAPLLRAFITDARARKDLLGLRARARVCSRRLAEILFGRG